MQRPASAYATRAAPRYTSYPTAPHFTPAVGPDAYLGWLGAVDADAPVSLYVHVPFCRAVCWYCACNMKLASRDAPLAEYAQSLMAEIDLIAAATPGRLRVGHLHFGGGTPTALAPDDLARIVERLRERFDFEPGAELAIESDPRTLTAEMAARIGALGFTRASFGVQEFDPEVQRAINRVQPSGMVREAVDRLRAAGVAAFNFDLIYGLPLQTVETLKRTVRQVAEIGPDRAALFGYAHVPWMSKRQRMIDADDLPDAAARGEMADAAAEAFERAGYAPVGIDHFARPDDPLTRAAAAGALRRNFQGYTDDAAETLIGFGATAIGRTPSGYVQNIAEPGAWAREVAAGRPPIARGAAFGGEDRLRAEVIERLMCYAEVDLDAAAARHGAPRDWWADGSVEIVKLAADGLIRRDGGRITLTLAGKPYVRVVAAAFDQYLARGAARHSAVV